MTTTTLIGVALSLAGGTVQSFGFILQKKGHNQVNEENGEKTGPFQNSVLSKWIWWLGLFIYTMGGALDSVALNYAPQSILSPVSAVKLGTIALLSWAILKEKVGLKDIIAIFIIIGGIIVVVIFGPSSDDNVDIGIEELREYFADIAYIITVIVLAGLVFYLFYFSKEKIRQIFYVYIVSTIIAFIVSKFLEKKNFDADENEDVSVGRNTLLFLWVRIGSFFAANNVLFIKAVVTIIIGSLTNLDQLETNATDWLSYVMIVLWFICLISMEYFRQLALSHFGALFVVPTFSVVSIIETVILGMVFYEEYKAFTLQNALLFTLGIIITVCGVVVLSFDIANYWTEKHDEWIKVALVLDNHHYKYPKMTCQGGPIAAYYQTRFLRKKPIFYDPANIDIRDLEQMVGKGSNLQLTGKN